MYPFTINALQRCGYEVHVATSHEINPREVMEYHGTQLGNVRVIKFPRLHCRAWNMPCDLVNATVSATKFLSLVKHYDLIRRARTVLANSKYTAYITEASNPGFSTHR